MADKKTILYVQTSGLDAPERQYAPLILATTAAAMGVDAIVYYLAKGVTVVKKGVPETIKMGAFPPLKDAMDQALKSGVKLMVCEQSCMLFGIPRGDFVAGSQVVGAATLNDLLLDCDAAISF